MLWLTSVVAQAQFHISVKTVGQVCFVFSARMNAYNGLDI